MFVKGTQIETRSNRFRGVFAPNAVQPRPGLENTPRVQVILMMGEPTVETASKAVRADAFDYLAKPIGESDLIKTCRSDRGSLGAEA